MAARGALQGPGQGGERLEQLRAPKEEAAREAPERRTPDQEAGGLTMQVGAVPT